MLLYSTVQLKFNYVKQPVSLVIFAKPYGEGLRRINLIKNLKDNSSLVIDTGNFLEGLSSILSGKLSLQRQNSLKSINCLNYFALVPSKNELSSGIKNLVEEQKLFNLPIICANLLVDNKEVFPAYKLINKYKYSIFFIGITSTEELKNLKEKKLLPDNSEILDPVTAIKKTLTEFQIETGKKPEIIIVLTNVEDKYLKDIYTYNRDVSIIISEGSSSFKKIKEIVEIDNYKETQSPIIIHSNPWVINLINIDINETKLKVENEFVPISFELYPDDKFLPEVMKVRHDANIDALDILIPDVKDIIINNSDLVDIFVKSNSTINSLKYVWGLKNTTKEEIIELCPPRITEELLSNMISNIIFRIFNNEVVILTPLHIPSIPGDIPKIIFYEMLKTDDVLEEYLLTGKQLKELMKINYLVFAGLNINSLQVWGKDIDDKEIYKTIILSNITKDEKVKNIIKNSSKKISFSIPFLNKGEKQEVYLRDLIIKYLENLKNNKNYKDEIAIIMKSGWNKKRPLLGIKFDDFKFNLKNYDVYNNENYSKVSETRVVSPKNFSMGGSGKFSVIYDDQDISFTNSGLVKYETSSIYEKGTEIFKELHDLLEFSSELKLNFFELSIKQTTIQLIPYIELLYDTEFRPNFDKDNNQNPRRSEINGVLGISVPKGEYLKRLKIGGILKKDFNILFNNIEAGIIFDLSYELPLWDKIKWKNNLEFRYYLPAPNDTEISLGLRTNWISSLDIYLTDNLVLNLFLDSFIFQGKLQDFSQIGASFLLGIGLSYDRLWKPFYENIFSQ